MNQKDERYTKFSLPQEMLDTVRVIRDFAVDKAYAWADPIVRAYNSDGFERILITGEGSSRLFPAKRALYRANLAGGGIRAFTEGATQAMEYDLRKTIVVGLSNSGKTKELVRLFRALGEHPHLYGITANPGTVLDEMSTSCFVLGCGPEKAVAATKSVVEQALTIHCLFGALSGVSSEDFRTELLSLADAFHQVLGLQPPREIVQRAAAASLISFAGRNTGVAEELTLKTNEITRKKSAYLEGTYAVHGIEEVMDADEAVIVVEPFESEEQKFDECLAKGVGVSLAAIGTREAMFPTFKIPTLPGWQQYLELAAGWNLLVEIGLELGIDMDTPVRARKVGNEFGG